MTCSWLTHTTRCCAIVFPHRASTVCNQAALPWAALTSSLKETATSFYSFWIVPLYLIRCLIVKPTWLRSGRTKFVPLCPVVTLWFWLVLITIIIFYPQVETLCNYHVGETVLSLQKATLIPGGSESLVYTTLSGGIGMLVPFTSREVGISCDQHPFSPSNINA